MIIPLVALAFYATEVRAGWNTCMKGQDMDCPEKWKDFKGYCIRFYKEQKTWQEANEACQGLLNTEFSGYGYPNYQGSLAAIKSDDMNDLLYSGYFRRGFDGQNDLGEVKKLSVIRK